MKSELDKFLKGKPISQMTPAEADKFANKIKNMPPTSTIGKFNAGIKKQIKEAMEKAAKEAAEKAGQSALKRCCKKGLGFAVRKIPICTVVFFCYDSYQGGVGHAVNEAVWPVSELWVD